jgi:hypothetical protein
MKITFKDIPKGFFRAQVSEIKEENGRMDDGAHICV